MTTQVGLLRGVNVGGKRKVPMAELRELLEGLGLSRVRTYIQSGNVVFDGDEDPGLPERFSGAMERRFGFPVSLVLRTAAELRATVDRVPFTDLDRLYVAFLDRTPTAAEVASLEPDRSPPDRIVVVGADVYLDLVNGAAKTKITNDWMDRRLRATSTSRNWRTVLALREMSGG